MVNTASRPLELGVVGDPQLDQHEHRAGAFGDQGCLLAS